MRVTDVDVGRSRSSRSGGRPTTSPIGRSSPTSPCLRRRSPSTCHGGVAPGRGGGGRRPRHARTGHERPGGGRRPTSPRDARERAPVPPPAPPRSACRRPALARIARSDGSPVDRRHRGRRRRRAPGSSSPGSSTSPGGSRFAPSATTRRRSPAPFASTSSPPRRRDGPSRRPPPLPSTGALPRSPTGRPTDGPPLPPPVFIEVRNTTDEALWVAVLDLTDRFRCHAVLPTVRSPPATARALGRRCDPGRASCRPRRGAGRDRPRLAEGDRQRRRLRRHGVRPSRARRATGRALGPRGSRPSGTLERLAAKAVSRRDP